MGQPKIFDDSNVIFFLDQILPTTTDIRSSHLLFKIPLMLNQSSRVNVVLASVRTNSKNSDLIISSTYVHQNLLQNIGQFFCQKGHLFIVRLNF